LAEACCDVHEASRSKASKSQNRPPAKIVWGRWRQVRGGILQAGRQHQAGPQGSDPGLPPGNRRASIAFGRCRSTGVCPDAATRAGQRPRAQTHRSLPGDGAAPTGDGRPAYSKPWRQRRGGHDSAAVAAQQRPGPHGGWHLRAGHSQSSARLPGATGLIPDGVVGPKTWAELQSADGASSLETEAKFAGGEKELGPETPQQEAKDNHFNAVAHFKAGQFAKALALWTRAYSLPELTLTTRRAMAFNMAACHMRLGQHEQAAAMYQEYLLFPGADKEKGLDFLRRARMGEALPGEEGKQPPVTPEQREAADAEAKKEIEAGDAAGKGDDFEGALEHYKIAYGARATSPSVRRTATARMGHALQKVGLFAKAIDMFQEVLAHPTTTDKDRLLMLEHIRQCRLELKEGEAQPPSMPVEEQKARFNAAVEAFNNADYETALAGFMAIYRVPGKPATRRAMAQNIGVCHQRLLRFEQAISWFQEVLLFPGLDEQRRKNILERIRQARMEEVATHLHQTEAKSDAISGNEIMLFAGMVFFETAGHSLGAIGKQTVRSLVTILKERHNKEPERAFRINLVGGSSSRWRAADSEEEAQQSNLELSQRRAESVQNELLNQLPAEDLEKGVYELIPNAKGDEVSDAFNLDPDDNTWTMRNVALTVWSPLKQAPQP
jgi:tetratricopeptide (TPR) repeat protein